MKSKLSFFISLLLILNSCGSGKKNNSEFYFEEFPDHIELREGSKPVFLFQKTIVSKDSTFFCNNFIHPLYSLDGDTLTELFPEDHMHHRGIFWAWHQIFLDTLRLGDGWMMEDVSFDIISVETSKNSKSAQLKTLVLWKSSALQSQAPFIEEQATITVQKSAPDFRLIDFEIKLRSLLPGISIGGSEDEKGYGGFSARIKLPEDLTFVSEGGKVIPQNLQIQPGQWLDFSATFNKDHGYSGIAILCHPDTPNYIAPWILRQQKSMQNIVFPGRERVKLTVDDPIVLRYRMVIHNGNAFGIDIPKLQSDYNKIKWAE